MRTFFLLVVLAVSAAAQTTCPVPNPFEGKWMLDVHTSDFGGLPGPTEGFVKFTIIDYGVVEYFAFTPKGGPRSGWHIFNPDGREYAIESSKQWDAVVLKKVGESFTAFEATYALKGHPVGIRRFVVIGNTMTIRTTLWATQTQGEMIVALVYRKKE